MVSPRVAAASAAECSRGSAYAPATMREGIVGMSFSFPCFVLSPISYGPSVSRFLFHTLPRTTVRCSLNLTAACSVLSLAVPSHTAKQTDIKTCKLHLDPHIFMRGSRLALVPLGTADRRTKFGARATSCWSLWSGTSCSSVGHLLTSLGAIVLLAIGEPVRASCR